MLKASTKLDDGTTLVILGLSDGNVREIRRGRPVLFPLKQVVADATVDLCIALKQDGGVMLPENFGGIAIAFSTEGLERLRNSFSELHVDPYKFLVFRGETEEKMERLLRQFVGPRTKVSHVGVSPSNIPPSDN